MLRSLYSGVSGMRSFQTKMDVISNNISNVNTTGFKSGRVKFQDMMSQTTANAQAASEDGLGGVNSQQIGLGVKVGAIDTIMTGGPLQATNRSLDFGIEGEGFFVVSEDEAGTSNLYTRDGAFYTDNDGNLVNSNGLRIMGYKGESGNGYVKVDNNEDYSLSKETLVALDIPSEIEGLELQEYTIDGTGLVKGVYSKKTTDDGSESAGDESESETYILGQVGVVSFNNPSGLEKAGNNNFVESNNSGDPSLGIAGEGGNGVIRQGFLEMSNVDLANEFTEMIVTSRAYQANSRSITTSDEMLQELINLKR